MKVIFDFDDVIFDSKRFKEILFQKLSQEGYEGSQEKYDQFRLTKEMFSLRTFLIREMGITSGETFERIYGGVMSFCEQLVNQDIVALMKETGPSHYIIITNGDKEFQLEKIRRSIGKDLVPRVVVVPGSKAEAVKEYCQQHPSEKVIFIDDRPHFIEDLHFEECPNLTTVLFDHNGIEKFRTEIEDVKEIEKQQRTPHHLAHLEHSLEGGHSSMH